MIVHKTLGSGISGAVRYVMGEGKRDPETGAAPTLAPGEESRVAWFGGTGFGFPIDSEERLDIARRVMEWAAQNQASKTKKCREDCLHLSLSWEPGENPGRAEMEAAAHSALERIGMGHARAIFAAHNDTDHVHLHLVVSRINPENGKAFPDSFDTKELSAWALDWEREHGGVRCAARLENEQREVERDPAKIVTAFAERRETFTAFDLNRELTRAIPSRDTRRQYIGEVLARPDFIKLADPETGQVMRYTTRQTLAAEHLATASGERLIEDRSHQVSGLAINSVLERLREEGTALRDDQMNALRHATGAEGLAVIAGKAGTGKSFVMSAIAAAYEAEGYQVLALAPTNKVASALKRDGLDAGTIHSALGGLDQGRAAWNAQTVVMVDEAGMISTRLMARLLSHAEHAGAKVILVGDDKQLASMERGGLFGYLAERYGAGDLSEITRQRGAEQRELAMRASRYDFKAALSALEARGGIVTLETPADRIAKAAEIWGERSASAPDASLFVVTVSNADAATANLAIRQIRRARGELGPDHSFATTDGPQVFATGDRILFSGSAASREDRAAGLVNGNAGRIECIEGDRISVALDGARPGELLTFTVGKNREAGEFDAIRHAYAGTIFKAQGATYDHAIVIDSPSMRASSGYVALTRHRESVTVVTARVLQPGFESWMAGKGGLAALTPGQRASAEKSYEKWRTKTNPEAGRRHDLGDYVAYVQEKEAERRAASNPVADMAKRWGRLDDRRAASRFEALEYQPPATGKMTPAEVRAAVGAFEQDMPQEPRRRAPAPKEARMEQDLPSEEALRRQPEREAEYLRHLQWQHEQAQAALEMQRLRELDERARAFQSDREREAEEARKKQDEYRAAEDRKAQEGDISSASARYAIALGENYNVRDPYASLARAAMSENAMFHRSREKMREEMAKEPDADKRRVIELRMKIESCDYMSITNDRLAGISTAVTGRADNAQAVIDRKEAALFRKMATALRAERSALIEANRERESAATPGVNVKHAEAAQQKQDGKAQSAAPAPETTPSQPGPPRQVAPASPVHEQARTAEHRPSQPEAAKTQPGAAPASDRSQPPEARSVDHGVRMMEGPTGAMIWPTPSVSVKQADATQQRQNGEAQSPAPAPETTPSQPGPPRQAAPASPAHEQARAAEHRPSQPEAARTQPGAALASDRSQPPEARPVDHGVRMMEGPTGAIIWPTPSVSVRQADATQQRQGGKVQSSAPAPEITPSQPVPPRQAASPAPAHEQARTAEHRPGQPEAARTQPDTAPAPDRSQATEAKPADRGLQVMDSATGAVTPLSEFVRSLPESAPARRRPSDIRAFLSDPAARKEQLVSRVEEIRQAETAEKALGRIGEDMERGKPLKADDIKSLTRDQRETLGKRGDDGLRQMVKESAQRAQGRGTGGREREQ